MPAVWRSWRGGCGAPRPRSRWRSRSRRPRCRSSPGPSAVPIVFDAEKFYRLPAEVALRLLAVRSPASATRDRSNSASSRRCSTACAAIAARRQSARLRRTLAGALVTLAAGRLTVERAPTRRTRMQRLTTAPTCPPAIRQTALEYKEQSRRSLGRSPRRDLDCDLGGRELAVDVGLILSAPRRHRRPKRTTG